MSQRNVARPPPDDSSNKEYQQPNAGSASNSDEMVITVSTSTKKSDLELVISPEKSAQEDGNENKELDEGDKSSLEDNTLVGEPGPAPVVVPEREPELTQAIFAIKYKHLNVQYESNRIFGRDTQRENKKRRDRRPNLKPIHKNMLIRKEYDFKKGGLSMTIDRRDGDLTFFTFDHSKDYQIFHNEFLIRISNIDLTIDVENTLKDMHVEGLLEAIDLMFKLGDNKGANTLVQYLVAYMQHIAHPSFNITDMRHRLEYDYPENRPFHIVLLKYLHLLSNRSCHRTALEIAKLLLNLDPSDPLAVVFIIDVLALRAREYQWLIKAVEYLDNQRDVLYIFNIKFSYALAHFHVAYKNKAKADLTLSDELLKEAMIAFPWTVKELLEASKTFSEENLRNHEFFSGYAGSTTCTELKLLAHLYVAFAGSWWNERSVREWLIRNGRELASRYERDSALKNEVKRMEQMRYTLFRGMPTEVKRHLSVIKYMANLLIEEEIDIEPAHSFDPHPGRDMIDRYNYGTATQKAFMRLKIDRSIVFEFFATLNPNFNPEDDSELYDFGPTLSQLRRAINELDEVDNFVSEDEESENEECSDGDTSESDEEYGEIEESEEEKEAEEDEEDEDEYSDGEDSANESEDQNKNGSPHNDTDEPE